MATPASSDLQVSSSSAWSSNHLIPSSLKLPSISHPWTFSPSTLLSSSPLPPETFLSQQMPPQSPCRAQTALLFPPLCPQLPSLQQLHMTEPILLSWFSMERKSLCFEGCFKNSPRHIQYLFRRGDPPPPPNNNKCISDTDKKLFLRFPGYLLMEEYDVLHIFIPPQRKYLPNMLCNPVRGCKKHCEGTQSNLRIGHSMVSSAQG